MYSSRLFQRVRRGLPLLLAVMALAACSPKFDWRTTRSDEGAYAAMYPAKPSQASRPVDIGGKRLPMTMEAARVDDTLFAIGVVQLEAATPQAQQAALNAMRDGLFANLGSHDAGAPEVKNVTIASAASPPVMLSGMQIRLSGVSVQDGAARRLTARLVVHGTRAYQAVVLESGKTQQDPLFEEQIEQFFAGFHPY
jgi:hypothetical protein